MDGLQARILITDDDRDFRESLGELLSRKGFETLLAEDGDAAVEMVRQRPVHLLMVDMHMPRLSGLETLATLRNLSIAIPSILMSAQLDDDILSRAKELDAWRVLAKPFSGKTITSTICEILLARYGWKIPTDATPR